MEVRLQNLEKQQSTQTMKVLMGLLKKTNWV
jgi:hypothetical protein